MLSYSQISFQRKILVTIRHALHQLLLPECSSHGLIELIAWKYFFSNWKIKNVCNFFCLRSCVYWDVPFLTRTFFTDGCLFLCATFAIRYSDKLLLRKYFRKYFLVGKRKQKTLKLQVFCVSYNMSCCIYALMPRDLLIKRNSQITCFPIWSCK